MLFYICPDKLRTSGREMECGSPAWKVWQPIGQSFISLQVRTLSDLEQILQYEKKRMVPKGLPNENKTEGTWDKFRTWTKSQESQWGKWSSGNLARGGRNPPPMHLLHKAVEICSLSGDNTAAFLMMVAADNVAAVVKYDPGSEPERDPDLLETRRERISTRHDWGGKWHSWKGLKDIQ